MKKGGRLQKPDKKKLDNFKGKIAYGLSASQLLYCTGYSLLTIGIFNTDRYDNNEKNQIAKIKTPVPKRVDIVGVLTIPERPELLIEISKTNRVKLMESGLSYLQLSSFLAKVL